MAARPGAAGARRPGELHHADAEPTCVHHGGARGLLGTGFLRLELVVVDDGTDPVADLMPDDTRVRYFGFPRAYRLA